MEREIELGTGSLTCTDHGSMGACSEVYELAKKSGLTPILGLEGYLRDDNCPILTAAGISKNEKGTFSDYNKYYHLVLHARNQEAYEALVKKLSDADGRAEQHGSERKPLFGWSALEELGSYDLTMTSGCLIGVVQRHLLSDRADLAIAHYEKMRSIPKKGNFYVEVFPHRCTHNWVSGVFIVLEGGEKIKYWKGKKVKVSKDSAELTVEQLAKMVGRGADPGQLIAVKNSHTWQELEPKQILDCKMVEEFMPNECTHIAPDGDVQRGANNFVIQLARKYGDKIIVSDDAHFAKPEEKMVQDARLMSSGGTWKFHNSYHRFSSMEAYEYFKNYMGTSLSEFEGWVDNNQEWAESFKGFKFTDRKSLPTKFYPENTLMHLKHLIDKHGRMDWSNKKWVERLQSEINLLHKNGTIDLLPYFFLDEEVVDLYDRNRLLTGPGRGSAAGLLTTYLLGITHVDPLKYDLSQDRFLTVDRIQSGRLPDIDQDLPDRDLLVDPQNGWLYERFGSHVAAISTNTMLRLRSSIKDVARAIHGHVDPEIEALCKKLPMPPQGIEDYDFIFGYTGDDKKEVKGLIEESLELQSYRDNRPHEWEIVIKMLGIARQKSRHACAYVIANDPIDSFIPLTTISGIRTTQYTAPSVEARGGLKMDFLVVNSLKDIGHCLQYVQERHGGTIMEPKTINGKKVLGHCVLPRNGQFHDIWDLPLDQNVFNDIASGRTESVFQLNTPSAKKWLKQFDYIRDDVSPPRKAIDSIEAISAFTALDRPGPLDAFVKGEGEEKGHNMLVEYARRARGEAPTDPIPAMDQLLPNTYGIMVYQEQLQAVYSYLTGCSGIEANNFRTYVAKKQMEKVNKAYLPFIESASQKIGEEQAKKVWEQIVTFGQYGFNKSHSICYSVIAYACAYLKHYYPLEWWCAVLRNATKKDISEVFWTYCSNLVSLPDIRYSSDVFEIQGNTIRAPLSFLHGVGPIAQEELAAGRPYTDIQNFCDKVVATKKAKTKVNPETGKSRMGTSALNYGVVAKLLISGVADSLFPADTTFVEMLEAYEKASRIASGKKANASVKPDKNRSQYLNLTTLSRYQLQKEILPIYSQDLVPVLANLGYHGVVKPESVYADHPWCFKPSFNYVKAEIRNQGGTRLSEEIPFRTGPEIRELNTSYLEDGSITVAAVGYILTERRFRYRNGDCEAVAVDIDIDGQTFQFVKWPDKESGELKAPKNLLGSIVLVIMTRYRIDRPFSIDVVFVVQPPLEADKDSSEEEKE